jgi:outer membrane protein OmpA-like peptidoglycan-associated protein
MEKGPATDGVAGLPQQLDKAHAWPGRAQRRWHGLRSLYAFTCEREKFMKRIVVGAASLVLLPLAAQAQSSYFTPGQSFPGFYIGAEGGLNWLLNTTITSNVAGAGGGLIPVSVSPQTGWAAGGVIGYDFVGPRVELEGVYRQNSTNLGAVGQAINTQVGQLGIMANLLYDFFPGATITPYVGAGAGIGFVDSNASLGSTVFAYQGIIGVGWNIDYNFRVNLDGRYYGTTNPTVNGVGWSNNNLSVMLGLSYKFGQPEAAPPPPAPPPPQTTSFMVFFDWDRSNLSQQALQTIQQAANAYRTKGSARITATGHTDRSGPENYNMALSLRRANTVKDALVRDGVPASAITVIGKGESQPLVQTADGVREPQNRRVEIVIQ